MEQVLASLAVGDKGKIAGYIKGCRNYRQKLMSMGLTPGADFRVVRLAPLGDPVEIKVRGFVLTLRREEAAVVKVEGVAR